MNKYNIYSPIDKSQIKSHENGDEQYQPVPNASTGKIHMSANKYCSN